MWRLAHTVLVAALAAACLAIHVQGAATPRLRRAIVGDFDESHEGQLGRRWYLGWAGSLGRAPPRTNTVTEVQTGDLAENELAIDSEWDEYLSHLAHENPDFLNAIYGSARPVR